MTNRLIVVTGASGVLGQSIVQRLLQDGHDVVGVSRRAAEFAGGTGFGSYEHISWDLSDISSLRDLSVEIMSSRKPLFGLINNAAVGTDGLLATLHDSEIDQVVRTNLTSPITLTKYLVRPMLSSRVGRIVNIGSIVARTGYRGLAAYGATKAALEGFTRSLARDVGRRGVTVNLVAPGFMESEMTESLDVEVRSRIRARSALGRFVEPTEVAAVVSFLVSENASGISGSIFTVDAGATA